MMHLAQAVREQIIKETPPRKGEKARNSTLRGLQRLGSWGLIAAGALLLVVLTSRSEVGSQRIAMVLGTSQRQAAVAPIARPPKIAELPKAAPPAFDAQVETRRLADAVRGLAADRDQIRSRLAAVEQDVHEMTDVTGSISREMAAADAVRHAAENGPTTAATAVASVSLAPVAAMTGAAARPFDFPAPAGAQPTQYGVDIGSGLTMEALRARWLAIYSAHPQLFDGMKPIVSLKETPRSKGVELRLIAGPIAQAAAATRLCAALTGFGLFCQPTLYDGQRLAQR